MLYSISRVLYPLPPVCMRALAPDIKIIVAFCLVMAGRDNQVVIWQCVAAPPDSRAQCVLHGFLYSWT